MLKVKRLASGHDIDEFNWMLNIFWSPLFLDFTVFNIWYNIVTFQCFTFIIKVKESSDQGHIRMSGIEWNVEISLL